MSQDTVRCLKNKKDLENENRLENIKELIKCYERI